MNTTTKTGLEGISDDGNTTVQSKKGGGYILLQRTHYSEPWECVAEARWYGDACSMVDQLASQV